MSEKPVEQMSFEEAMAELERVVSQLESGEVALEQSISLYDRGDALKKRCDTLLKAAEEKVAAIKTDSNGNATGTAPFDAQ